MERSYSSQFEKPRGLGGHLAGWTMAWWNAGINALACELLEPTARDHILEIGVGPGTLIRQLSSIAQRGFVAGIDPSPTMLAQAERRNRPAITRGRVELKRGEIGQIPYPDSRFDKVCTVNTIYFWPEPVAAAREVWRAMRDGGRFVLAFRAEAGARSFSARMGLAGYAPERARQILETAGFNDIRLEVRPVRLMTAACVIARKIVTLAKTRR